MHKPPIRDVAKRATVSLKTVSRVINHEPAVRERTRARVMNAMARGFDPDMPPYLDKVTETV